MKKILLINGPNLNMLGKRDHKIYGNKSFSQIINLCKETAQQLNLKLEDKQSNNEGDIINWIQQSSQQGFNHIIINPAAYAHTSIAIMDAIKDCDIPVIEVHISNIYAREKYRQHSYTATASQGVITGFGWYSYILALYVIAKM